MKNVPTTRFERVPPGPMDLTPEKIESRMEFIKPGDKIRFDSQKECYVAEQVDRLSTIKATGTVIANYGGYLAVKLRRGVIEYVNYFGIESVNGKHFVGYSVVK